MIINKKLGSCERCLMASIPENSNSTLHLLVESDLLVIVFKVQFFVFLLRIPLKKFELLLNMHCIMH